MSFTQRFPDLPVSCLGRCRLRTAPDTGTAKVRKTQARGPVVLEPQPPFIYAEVQGGSG
jgi:hypothetical protein